jgi:hypothetical protein
LLVYGFTLSFCIPSISCCVSSLLCHSPCLYMCVSMCVLFVTTIKGDDDDFTGGQGTPSSSSNGDGQGGKGRAGGRGRGGGRSSGRKLAVKKPNSCVRDMSQVKLCTHVINIHTRAHECVCFPFIMSAYVYMSLVTGRRKRDMALSLACVQNLSVF